MLTYVYVMLTYASYAYLCVSITKMAVVGSSLQCPSSAQDPLQVVEPGSSGSRSRRAHTLRATCAVCERSMPVTRAGVFRIHGPCSNRCEGSGMLPSAPLPVASTTQSSSAPTVAASPASRVPSAANCRSTCGSPSVSSPQFIRRENPQTDPKGFERAVWEEAGYNSKRGSRQE